VDDGSSLLSVVTTPVTAVDVHSRAWTVANSPSGSPLASLRMNTLERTPLGSWKAPPRPRSRAPVVAATLRGAAAADAADTVVTAPPAATAPKPLSRLLRSII
jgi:hypothetical protein